MRADLEDKVRRSCLLIRHAYRHVRHEGSELELAYSGGKDSDVMLELCRMSGVVVRAIHRCTTIDPPYTLRHCLDNGVEVLRPRRDFRWCIERKGFPTRYKRHCCSELKEYAVLDYVLIGVRRDESVARCKRYTCDEDLVTYRGRGRCMQYYPLLDWSDADICDFINERGIKCHPLYYDADGVFHVERRLGCMCCPMVYYKRRIEEFVRYPRMVRFYLRHGKIFWDTHPDSYVHGLYRDVYDWFVCDVFCKDLSEFRSRFLSSGVDCRRYLEDYFGLDLCF